MSVWEYNQRLKASQLHDLDQMRYVYLNAWANRLLSGYDTKGNFVIKELKELFDYEKLEKVIQGKVDKKEVQKVNELKERADRAARAKQKARQIMEERRKMNGDQ